MRRCRYIKLKGATRGCERQKPDAKYVAQQAARHLQLLSQTEGHIRELEASLYDKDWTGRSKRSPRSDVRSQPTDVDARLGKLPKAIRRTRPSPDDFAITHLTVSTHPRFCGHICQSRHCQRHAT